MIHNRIDIWNDGEYDYGAAYGFRPNLRSYLHEDEVRPCVLVIPGGGYRVVSPSEGEIVAKKFYDLGYQAFVGTYTTDFIGNTPLKTQPLRDISRMVRVIRARAGEYGVDPDRIVLCGFSAGAHLCGSLCVHWRDVEDSAYGVSNRPDGAILSYPVITSGKYAHRDSFAALLGEDPDEKELEYLSLEKQVTNDTPPVFLWQTATDELVPVQNSCLMASALMEKGIPMALHIFSKGKHGLSLGNVQWEDPVLEEPYTLEQMACIERAAKEGRLTVDPFRMRLMAFFLRREGQAPWPAEEDWPGPEVTVWPDLAACWIRKTI